MSKKMKSEENLRWGLKAKRRSQRGRRVWMEEKKGVTKRRRRRMMVCLREEKEEEEKEDRFTRCER